MIFARNRAKTVPISCSLHADRAKMRTCFFGPHFVGTAVELLGSLARLPDEAFALPTRRPRRLPWLLVRSESTAGDSSGIGTVMKKVGLPKGGFYRRFESKDDNNGEPGPFVTPVRQNLFHADQEIYISECEELKASREQCVRVLGPPLHMTFSSPQKRSAVRLLFRN